MPRHHVRIHCSVFQISVIVTVTSGSCLMIASQEAINSELQ